MKKINWKDFKIKDEQPNLIENGWDSFQPVGSGVSLFRQWNFDKVIEFDDAEWNGVYSKSILFNNVLRTTYTGATSYLSRFFPQRKSVEMGKEYILRIKIKNPYWNVHLVFGSLAPLEYGEQGSPTQGYVMPKTDEYIVHEVRCRGRDDNNRVELFYSHARFPQDINIGEYFDIAWLSLTPVDDQHLVVEKTPLGNGLTRIQTWGGNESGKLRFIANSEKVGEPLSFSMYIENNGDDIALNHDAPSTNNSIEKGYKGFFETKTEVSVGEYKYIGIGTEGNLDFIASEPQFVEGNKSNPVLLINELEDGREHVQVHGVKNDTKLISPKIEGLSGEPYQIKTDIENNGIEMSMDTTLGDKSISVGKGENSVSHTGELQGQHIIFELGAKDE